ncbi:MAG TPA: ATP-binding protein [Gaiellaceae bacterium]|nr:ATP-binding protein [Gaiellaceae bacterium]
MRLFRFALWPAGAALGILAERLYFGWGDGRHWIPDLVTGWSLIACGLVGWSRRPESRSGALMAATGFAWFAGNFATADLGPLDWLAAHALYLYRGPLFHLALSYPRGRLAGRIERAAVAVGYVAAIVTPAWRSGTTTIVLASLLVGVAGRSYLRSAGRERRERLAALQATTFLGAVLAADALVRFAVSTEEAKDATLLANEAALVALAVSLLAGLLRWPWERAEVTDFVVELGEARSGTLRDALARALGDPTLELGYWLPESGAYVDAAGRSLELPAAGSARAVTRVERDGQAVAVLVHDPAVLDDPGLVEAVAAAARLAASNARLQAEVRAQVSELQESRRRLVRAGDEERRRLEQRLREGAERRLVALGHVLERASGNTNRTRTAEIERARDQLARALADLHDLARGLHPRTLTEQGLEAALASLARRSPVPVELAVPAERLPAEVEAAAYFICSEALANIAKYASASRVVVRVTADDRAALVEIVDDGVGGADPAQGSGLRGLADRVEALGGALRLESPPGGGTRLSAELPLHGEAPSGDGSHRRADPPPRLA